MADSVECPNCGGKLSPGAGDSLVTCIYCGSTVRLDPSERGSNDHTADQMLDEITDLLRRGKKIEAIKIHRRHSSGTLKESKLAVEKIGREAGIPVKTGSCSVLAATLILFILMVLSAAVI
ncbi:MAG: hypothetical protein R6U39_09570 [Candidatus Aegiribacteria sp.]